MTSPREVVIVGAGLFGSIAATLARHRGHHVTIIDNKERMAASKASGCVLAPSWLSSLSPQQLSDGMNVLKTLYTVYDMDFKTNLGATFKAQRVNPDDVLLRADVTAKVTSVKNGVVSVEGGTQFRGQVLVAAGIWSADLVGMPAIKGLYGSSARFRAQLPVPRIHVYAPYRQAVGFQMTPKTVWFGDGTALVRKSWEENRAERIQMTLDRAGELMGVGGLHLVAEGARPYVEGFKAGYFDRVSPNTWVSTGGAKNGTVLAAAQAHRFIQEAKL
jgi:glycine/D-amino acid oxidase-like deaminating enzyme